jgi:RimJ/RimL family protein N-acetyltransferase
VIVRPATSEDVRGVAAVHVDSWRAAYPSLLPQEMIDRHTLDSRERMWRTALSGLLPMATWVAEAGDGRITGFCSLADTTRNDEASAGTAEIAGLYVDPSEWRGGIGAALARAALEYARAEGSREVTVWVLDGNAPAISFYERFAFADDGRVMEFGGEGGPPAKRMRLGLND